MTELDTFTLTRLMEESTKANFLSKQEEAKTARRTQIDVVFDNTNITKNLNEFLIISENFLNYMWIYQCKSYSY